MVRVLLLAVFAAGCGRIEFDELGDDTGSNGQPVCTEHWCWERPPNPEAMSLRAVGGSSATDVWAVGDAGVIRRWDGARWRTMTSPTRDALTAIAVASPTDVTIAAGAGTLWHYDGASWTASQTPSGASVGALWRDPSGKLFAAGEVGTMSADGNPFPPAPVRVAATALHGIAATSFWHVGLFNTITRWDSGGWLAPITVGDFPYAVWSLSTGDAFVGGTAMLSCVASTLVCGGVASNVNARGMFGFSDTDIWSVGTDGTFAHFDGASWQVLAAPAMVDYFAVWGAAPNDMWAVGDYGAIAHYDGAAWTSLGDVISRPRWRTFWIGDDTDRLVGDGGLLFRDDGTTLQQISLPDGGTIGDEIRGPDRAHLCATNPGNSHVTCFDGAEWRDDPALVLPMPLGLAVTDNEILLSGFGQIVAKPANGTWSTVFQSGSEEFNSVCISDAGTLGLTVGRFGDAVTRTTGTWVRNDAPSGRRLLACDFGGEQAWAAGGDSVVTWVNNTWTDVTTTVPTGQTLFDVLAVSTTEVYVVGSSGRIVSFDGSAWREEATPTTGILAKIRRSASGSIYAIGDGGAILRRR